MADALPVCIVTVEAERLDAGRGLAVIDRDARVGASEHGCRFDAGAVLLAREEGRGPPEVIAWDASLDGSAIAIGGPLGLVAFDVPASGGRVRVRALQRGDRFPLVPFSIERAMRGENATFTATAKTPWSAHATAGAARWIDDGVPVVVEIDPSRDHEPLSITLAAIDDTPAVLVIDAGVFLGEPPSGPQPSRREDLAAGGARAISALLVDLPLSIVGAVDDATARDRLREAARSALAASRVRDPIVATVGVRLTSAIASGFTTCARDGASKTPDGWPAVSPAIEGGGALLDAEVGCPIVADLLAANHPVLAARSLEEGRRALVDALAAPPSELPTIGALTRARSPLGVPARAAKRPASHRRFAVLVGLLVALAVLAALVLRRDTLRSPR